MAREKSAKFHHQKITHAIYIFLMWRMWDLREINSKSPEDLREDKCFAWRRRREFMTFYCVAQIHGTARFREQYG